MTVGVPDSGRVATRELVPSEYDEWSALVASSEQGSVYGLPAYLEALCRATGAQFKVVGAFLNGQLVGGVPLYERRARSGAYVANRLLLYYNGIVLKLPPKKFPSDATAQELAVLEALADELGRRPYVHIQLHNRSAVQDIRPFLARGWQARLSYTYIIPLTEPARHWERVDPNLKRLIGRCERDGVEYVEDDDFDALFRLHLQTHQRKGAPLYLPEKAFADFYAELKAGGLARLGHAVFDGKIIASQLMVTGPHTVAHTVCAGADDDYLRMGASAFLRWHSCLSLARSGYVANDLTDAALNPVTRFKSQLGGELTATWSISRSQSLAFRIESALQRWRHNAARQRAEQGGGSP